MKLFKDTLETLKQFEELKEKNSINLNLEYIFCYYKRCFRNCLKSKAKSSAQEFWNFIILNLIIGNILYQMQTKFHEPLFLKIYLCFVTIPFISLLFHRLNDIKKSKYWLGLPPFLFLLLYFSYSFINNWLINFGLAMLFVINLGILLYWSFLPGVRKL